MSMRVHNQALDRTELILGTHKVIFTDLSVAQYTQSKD